MTTIKNFFKTLYDKQYIINQEELQNLVLQLDNKELGFKPISDIPKIEFMKKLAQELKTVFCVSDKYLQVALLESNSKLRRSELNIEEFGKFEDPAIIVNCFKVNRNPDIITQGAILIQCDDHCLTLKGVVDPVTNSIVDDDLLINTTLHNIIWQKGARSPGKLEKRQLDINSIANLVTLEIQKQKSVLEEYCYKSLEKTKQNLSKTK